MTIQQATHLAFQHHQAGRLAEAEALYRRILATEPRQANALHMLGLLAHQTGRHDTAVELIGLAVGLTPDNPVCYANLSEVLRVLGRVDEAIAASRAAVRLRPDSAPAHNNLGLALKDRGKLDEAAACYRRALELNPDLAAARNNLGVALRDQGELDEAIACYLQAMTADPHNSDIHSNLIHLLHYHPAHDAASIHEQQRRWERSFAEPLRAHLQPHSNARDPERRLRLGYVSSGFGDHVVGRNVLPVLKRHDRSRFEIFCYAGVTRLDPLTRRFQAASDAWRNIAATSDHAVADLIRADGIDLLVDLTLHTAGQRLAVFARKPAPLQVTWAGYPGATGLGSIDYRITDPYLDPPGACEEPSSEAPIRLPHSFWCYDPLTGAPPVNPLPALSARYVTFGSLNSYCKVNASVIALWSRVLCAVQESRLLLLSPEGAHRERALKAFQGHRVAPERLEWFTPTSRPEYLAAYHRIDLALDTFPYNGHTTSLDSAWMGVPVITLVGNTIVGRGGLSQAMNLGLPELVAYSPDQYVQIATDLAHDVSRLSELRATLRDRMQASPLMDAPRFTRNLEAAYRQMWQRWCAR